MNRGTCLALIVVIVLAESTALAVTVVGGPILSDTTWMLAAGPYVVADSIVVGAGATLTIKPGVVVEFRDAMILSVGSADLGTGALVARGTAESPIVFTTSSGSPEPGKWSRIHFTDYAVDATFDEDENYLAGGILEHVIVEYAGYGNYGAVFAEKSAPYLSYCEVRHNSYYGIRVDATDAPGIVIDHCEVYDHPQLGIYINSGNTGHKLRDSNIHHNRDAGLNFSDSSGNSISGNTIAENTSLSFGGGLILSASSNNKIIGNTISGNTATYGGGLYSSNSSNNTLSENTISQNTAWDHGGGLYFVGGYGNTVSGNTINTNTASDNGGGLYFYDVSGYTVNRNTISGNTASYGGGLFFFFNSSSDTFSGNTISGNTALIDGGGLYLLEFRNSAVSGNTISGNTAPGLGGGLYFVQASGNTVSGNVISGNTAAYGGGLYSSNSFNNTLSRNTISQNAAWDHGGGLGFGGGYGNTVRENTIEGNTASDNGGGLYLYDASSYTVNGNTIRENTASYGGGLFFFFNSSSNTFSGNAIGKNTALIDGGGLYLIEFNNSEVSKNTISGNKASGDGGGLYFSDSSGDALNGNAIIGNRITGTGTAGGVYVTNNSQQISLAGNLDTGLHNAIACNDGYQVRNNNAYRADGLNDVNAQYVDWGTGDTAVIQAGIWDYLDDGMRAFVFWSPPAGSVSSPGDVNCDGFVDLEDIEPFIFELFDLLEYLSRHPDCNWRNGDMNGDCSIDGLDIDLFTQCLLAGGCP